MAFVSIREAARLTGKSVHTIYRRIRNGGLSSTMTPQGETKVDIAELSRVFGDFVASATASSTSHEKNRDVVQQHVDIQLLQTRLEATEARLQMMQLVIETKDQLISVLKQNNDDLRLLLPSPNQNQQPAPDPTGTEKLTPVVATPSHDDETRAIVAQMKAKQDSKKKQKK